MVLLYIDYVIINQVPHTSAYSHTHSEIAHPALDVGHHRQFFYIFAYKQISTIEHEYYNKIVKKSQVIYIPLFPFLVGIKNGG